MPRILYPCPQINLDDDERAWRDRAALLIAQRFALAPHIAALVAALAGLGVRQ